MQRTCAVNATSSSTGARIQAARWSGAERAQRRVDLRAGLGGEHAARMEAAAVRQRERRPAPSPRSPAAARGSPRSSGCCRAGPACRGAAGRRRSPSPERALDDPAGVHHRHLVGHLGDHAEIVRDQDDRHAGLLLQVAQQVEDLRLHGDVERGGRLVGDQQVGLAGQRHGDHHALAHAAATSGADIPRSGARRPGCAPARSAAIARCAARRSRCVRSCARIASVIWSPTVNTGFSDVIGSWKIIAIRLPRMSRICAGGSFEQVAGPRTAPGPAAMRPGCGTRRMTTEREHALAAAALADDAERLAAPTSSDAVHRGTSPPAAENGANVDQRCCASCARRTGRAAPIAPVSIVRSERLRSWRAVAQRVSPLPHLRRASSFSPSAQVARPGCRVRHSCTS